MASRPPPWAPTSPSVDLSLQRSYGSRLSDLFIPSSIDLSLGQDLRKTTDLTQTTMYIRPKTTTRAVNLFGQLGATRFSKASARMSTASAERSIDGGPQLPTMLSTLSAEAYASLTGTNESELTFVETFRGSQTTS